MLRTSKYGSVKITGTDLTTVEGEVIEILADAVFTTINEAGITAPITSHNVSGVQSAGERIFAHTKFTGVQLTSGSVRVGGYQRRKKVGLSGIIKNAFVLWLYGRPPREQYVTDKHGQQDRELLDGEIFPGRGYEGDQTNYVTLGSDIVFADSVQFAVSCFVEWDVIAQTDGVFGNLYTVGNYTRLVKIAAGTGYAFSGEVNNSVTWTITVPTVRHHILIQCDGLAVDNLELFIDGVSQGTKTMADTESIIHNIMTAGGAQNPLDGQIDDFRVYDRLLDSAEIAALQTKDALGGELLWYPCEDVYASIAYDASGNANHGTKVSWVGANHVEGNWQNLMNKYGYNQDVTYDEVPADMSSGVVPTLDVLGNDLVYAGQADYHGISVDAACFAGDGVAYYTFENAIVLDETSIQTIAFEHYVDTSVTSWRIPISNNTSTYGRIQYKLSVTALYVRGDSNVEIFESLNLSLTTGWHTFEVTLNAGQCTVSIDGVDYPNQLTEPSTFTMTFHRIGGIGVDVLAGLEKLRNVKIGSLGWYPFCEGAGITAYDVSGNGNHTTGTSVDETNWGYQDDFHYLRDYGLSTLGANKVINGIFDTDTNWAKQSGWTIVDGKAVATATTENLWQTTTGFVAGTTYRITYTISDFVSGSVKTKCGDAGYGTDRIADGTYIEDIVCVGNASLYFDGIISFTGKIDNVSAKELNLVIPVLADKTTDALGNDIEYPQSGPNAIPDTYFHLPENIAELTAADLEDRYLGIMDEGKGTFDSGTESWEAVGTNTIENDNGALKITYVDSALGARHYLRETKDLNTDLTIGRTYKIRARVKVNTGTVNLKIYRSGTDVFVAVNETSWTWKELIFVADAAVSNYFALSAFDAGEIIWIDEWFIMEQQTSIGNNFITDGEGEKWADDNSDGVANGWVHSSGTGTPAIVTGNGFVGNAQKIDHVTATQTDFNYTPGGNTVNGQTYQLSIKYRSDISVQIYLRTDSDAFTADLAINTGDAITWTATVDATAAAAIILNFRMLSGTANGYIEIDEVELRPVIDSFFYEPEVLGLDPVIINTSDLPDYRYLVQYYNSTNRKDLVMLEAGHSLDADDHKKLLKFTKNS